MFRCKKQQRKKNRTTILKVGRHVLKRFLIVYHTYRSVDMSSIPKKDGMAAPIGFAETNGALHSVLADF